MKTSARPITRQATGRLAYGVLELSGSTGVSPGHIRNEWQRGNLKGVKVGRRLLFTADAVDEWLRLGEAER